MSYNAKNYTEQGGETTHFGGKVVFEEGCEVEGLFADPLLPATADTLGGVKIGDGLSIDEDGVLSVIHADNQEASEASTVAELAEDFNSLLSKLKAAGFMEADTDE